MKTNLENSSNRECAHYLQTENEWKKHYLDEHLESVGKLSDQFAQKFLNGDWARLIGLWHDLGKYNPEWQIYLQSKTGYNEDIHKDELREGKIDHSTAGAIFAFRYWEATKFPQELRRVFSYCISGHHAGLPDWTHEMGVGGSLDSRLKKNNLWEKAMRGKIPIHLLQRDNPTSNPMGSKKKFEPKYFHHWIRFLFSSLIDADRLDTEEFMNKEKNYERNNKVSINDLRIRLKSFIDSKVMNASKSELNQIRGVILEDCLIGGRFPQGFFTMTVPTGGGKTLSSLAFALEHCLENKLDRVIMVIPYTSIIEQTADVYRQALGEESVIEHHSNVDPEDETTYSMLACENWDAPLIVTTNVQFFESLFSAKTSSCRKLHNIANSVIVLDEAQMIPCEHLRPILDSLNFLVKYARCSVVFCSATQPALVGTIGINGREEFEGISSQNVIELMKT